MRFRTTALPSLRVTVKPMRGSPASSRILACTTQPLRAHTSAAAAARKSCRRFRCCINEGNPCEVRKADLYCATQFTDQPASRPIRRSAWSGHARGDVQLLCGRRQLPCGRGSRGDACEQDYWVETCVSWLNLQNLHVSGRVRPRRKKNVKHAEQ